MVVARRGLPAGHPIHGVEVPTGELERLLVELVAMSPEQRRDLPGLKPERADIIVAGLAVAAELLDRVAANGVTVSGFGLREGVLLEMLDLE
jgi:exopolyphosphatase/guanosine-5'-triphosphate,3'-diphosphate pyrophosphatase